MNVSDGGEGAARPNHPPRTHREFQVTMVSIVVALGNLLSLKKTFPDLSQDLITLTEEVVDGLCTGSPCLVGQQGRWRPPKEPGRASYAGRCGRRCCSSTPPMAANPPRHADDTCNTA
jgi:hypothetical protein